MAAKWKKSEKKEADEWQDASLKDIKKFEKESGLLICHNCGFVICEFVYAPETVRCPGCDKVIRHLGQKC